MTHHIWLVYDRLTGQGPNPPGLRGESGVYVSAETSDAAKAVGTRALRGVDLRDIRHRRAMRGTQSIPDPGPTRVLSRDEAAAHRLDVGRMR